jgi:hypothetical protein
MLCAYGNTRFHTFRRSRRDGKRALTWTRSLEGKGAARKSPLGYEISLGIGSPLGFSPKIPKFCLWPSSSAAESESTAFRSPACTIRIFGFAGRLGTGFYIQSRDLHFGHIGEPYERSSG